MAYALLRVRKTNFYIWIEILVKNVHPPNILIVAVNCVILCLKIVIGSIMGLWGVCFANPHTLSLEDSAETQLLGFVKFIVQVTHTHVLNAQQIIISWTSTTILIILITASESANNTHHFAHKYLSKNAQIAQNHTFWTVKDFVKIQTATQ